jgi:type IV pilus assembly protein PilY1
MLGADSSTEHDKIIDFTRGIDVYDEDTDGNTTEERPWKLGDIFHSNPVLVSPPFLPLSDSTYTTFRTTNANRTTILLAGANDGMLHAFRESDGQELWAFIPSDNLARLKDLTVRSGEHEFYLDASPIVTDIKVGTTWKTIAIIGERRGGSNYYALDITKPDRDGHQGRHHLENDRDHWRTPLRIELLCARHHQHIEPHLSLELHGLQDG